MPECVTCAFDRAAGERVNCCGESVNRDPAARQGTPQEQAGALISGHPVPAVRAPRRPRPSGGMNTIE
ncbi:MAG TPA: hypothetical protein VHZ03_54390 [Trebonia sp.]|nr:hypothetical protein [Trebonia sp.]